jgi:hypothetical protein
MILALGTLAVLASISAFWYFLPRDEKVHPLATAPYLETIIPLSITISGVLGIVLIAMSFVS